jgi:AcrR family transcriptional regulator
MQSRGKENNYPLQRRRAPLQKRSQKRINDILDVTVRLLARVGLDDLTTVLIARDLGISIGSVYHYFPNKFSILYAVGERWLEEMTRVLGTVESWDLDQMGIEGFVDQYCDEMLKTYRLQIAVLPLVQAMVTMPELRKLDELHDEEIISCLMKVCRRLGSRKKDDELNRIGCLVLEISHALFMVIVEQNKKVGSKTLTDLKKILKEYMRQQMASD